MSAASERLRTPLLFPCAAKVKVPQLGSEDSDLKAGGRVSRHAPDAIVFQRSGNANEPVNKHYLRNVSTGLSFEEDVVKERCFHALPYDEKYMYEAFNIGDLVSLPPKTRVPVGRHNPRGVDVRHMPCNLTKSTKSHLKPLKRQITIRAQQMHIEALKREEMKDKLKKVAEAQKIIDDETHERLDEQETADSTADAGIFVLTETKDGERVPKQKPVVKINEEENELTPLEDIEEEKEEEKKPKRGNDWDAYLMSILSTNTANWIVYERTPVGSQDREKLSTLLKKWYGEPEHTDLVREDMSNSESESEEEEVKPTKKWKKKEATLLEKVYNLEDAEPEAVDPYSDDNKAPFYRQPAGLRRARKHEEKEELGAINSTAAKIEVKTIQAPPPPTLRDYINPSVGETLIETDNMFQQEQLTGTEQIYEMFGDQSKIVMASNNKYKKSLQPQFPQPPEVWFPETDAEKKAHKQDMKKQRKKERGLRRWKKLPDPIDDTAEVLKVMPPGLDSDFERSADPRTRKTAKSNASLMQIREEARSLNFADRGSFIKKYNPRELLEKMKDLKRQAFTKEPFSIIDEWRTKWHLAGQYVDSTPDDLIKDMADIQAHVRLKAVATCAKAAEYRPPADNGIQLDFMDKGTTADNLPERLFLALECLLEDPVDKVRTASAITLYSLNRPCEKAQEILYGALQGDNPVDRWAAAQCLAHYGVCDSDVVGEMLQQVMTTEDTIKHERGISMLGVLSVTSTLVHSMVAEQLNSSSWRHKIIACKILPTLRGDINKDITNKLSDLMWNDWHADVRRAAAQCLGKTGHGRDVHDELRARILGDDERLKLEALSKVGQLGIMTAKLLPAFLQCFEDEHVSVRSEVCITCGNLAIKDEEITAKLIHLATFDNIWKVKALAIQALGKIGLITEEIVDCLLWAVRYEENEGVRAEACHTLMVLQVRTEEVADVIQDRYLVEPKQVVRDELAALLKMFDISASEDMDMVAQIKKEVKKLCTRNIIATQITLNELDDDRRQNLARMIYETEGEMKAQQKVPEPVMERIRSMSRASSQKSKPGSAPGTPDQPREILFTPTADQELEAILNKGGSGLVSPTTTTPGSKSHPTTASSGMYTEDEEEEEEQEEDAEQKRDESEKDEKEEEDGEETETEATMKVSKPSPGEDEHGQSVSSVPQTPVAKRDDDDEEEPELARVTQTQETDRPTSTVKFAPHLEVADIPVRSRSSLGPSRLSLMDEHGKPSRNSMATTGTEGIFGREAVLEREKINEEAMNTFNVMDTRYQDLVQYLVDIDNAFELDLTSGSRMDFENKIQEMKIVKSPPSTASGKGGSGVVMRRVTPEVKKVEMAADEVVDVDDGGKGEKGKVKDSGKVVKGEKDGVKDVGKKDTSGEGVKGKEKIKDSKNIEVREKSDIEIVVTKPDGKNQVDQ